MRRIFGLIFILSVPLALFAQSASDPIIMKINGVGIPRSEFEYSYNKNKVNNTSLKDYVDLYINYRLKIQEAEKQQINSSESFKQEYASYRDGLLMKYFSDSAYQDSIVRSVYEKVKEQLHDSDILNVSHILIRIPQRSIQADRDKAKAKMDTIYQMLQGGADFALVAQKYSQDKGTAEKGGEIPPFGPSETMTEFEKVCYSLKAGEMSKPFLSPMGYHVILMRSRNKLEPYEAKKQEILTALNKQGLPNMVFEHAIQNKIAESGGKLTREEILDNVQKEHEGNDAEMRQLLKDYYDGLLVFDVTKHEVWDPAETDTLGLEKYFNAHKKDFAWDSPRYKGFVFHASDEKIVGEVKKILAKNEKKGWSDIIKKEFNSGSKPQVMVSHNLWKEGDNRYIDKYIFKKPNIEIQEGKSYPYWGMQGRILKKGPEELADVRAQVTSDYQDVKEKEWIKGLRDKSKVEVFNDVVSTVDKH